MYIKGWWYRRFQSETTGSSTKVVSRTPDHIKFEIKNTHEVNDDINSNSSINIEDIKISNELPKHPIIDHRTSFI